MVGERMGENTQSLSVLTSLGLDYDVMDTLLLFLNNVFIAILATETYFLGVGYSFSEVNYFIC